MDKNIRDDNIIFSSITIYMFTKNKPKKPR